MIEKIIIDHLAGALTAPVGPEIPEGPPERFVTVEKAGQYELERGVMHGDVVIRSNAGSVAEAMELDADVRAAMRRLPEQTNVFRCRLENSYNDTNTALKQRRYLSEFEITFKEDTENV